jgi:ribosomal protein L37AE/L43A
MTIARRHHNNQQVVESNLLRLSPCRIALNQPEPDDTDAHRHQSWAERQAEYTGTDPLRCSNCDQPLTFEAHPFVWECHDCHNGVVIPGTYKNIHGEIVTIDPKSLNPDTEVMRF